MAGKKSDIKWSDIKRQLQSLEEPDLLAMIHDLFKLSVENRAFLAARLLGASTAKSLLPPYLERIERAFYKQQRHAQVQWRPGEAREAIREYRKATADPVGSLELMLTFLETGTGFTRQFGGLDEPFYNNLTSVLGESERLLESEGEKGRELYHQFRDRFLDLVRLAYPIGWGYCDEVKSTVDGLESRYAED